MAITLDVLNVGEFALDTASTTVALTTVAAVAAGATIIVTGTNVLDFNLTSVANTGSAVLSWAIDKQGGSGSSNSWLVSAYAASGLASGATITATFAGSTAGGRSITATSFKGILSATPVDTTSGPTNYLGTPNWTTASTAIQAGSLLIAVAPDFTDLRTSTVTAPSIEAHDFGNGGFSQTTCYRIESSAGSYTVAGVFTANGDGSVCAAAYKAAPTVASLADDPPMGFLGRGAGW